ncbi:MAG: aconitase X [Hyphomicrobiales bacterium]
MTLVLEAREQKLLDGSEGPAMRLAMRLVARAADIMGATTLVPISFAHIDACFYAGEAHVDFAQHLVDHGARFAVPAWTNSGLVSLADPGLRPEAQDPEMISGARRLMALYERLGCRPVWTCAPYQLPGGPRFGDHIVVGESNAVTYYNSVIGARTNKYGDYLDVACALLGRAPLAGLHTDAGRKADILFRTGAIGDTFRSENIFFHLLGHHVGRIAGTRIPVIEGLPGSAKPHDLKALSAAAAASGGVDLWHGVGVTPEAPVTEAVFSHGEAVDVIAADLERARDELSTYDDGPLDAVALGTPHFSLAEFETLLDLFQERKARIPVMVSTSRYVRDLAAGRGWASLLQWAGVTVVVDTCTYFSPPVRGLSGHIMTNAAKWAYYAPGMLNVDVCFGSLRECVESAIRGEVWRDRTLWSGR